jgi:hypothetical protein
MRKALHYLRGRRRRRLITLRDGARHMNLMARTRVPRPRLEVLPPVAFVRVRRIKLDRVWVEGGG